MNFKNKRIFSLFLSLMLVFGMFLTPMSTYAEEAEAVELTIIHTNDVHSRVKGNDEALIGYARLATKVKELKEENPNVLVLDAGDTTHGLPIATISKGESIINLMNKVGYDAMTPGNHDFNYGYKRLLELSKKAEFPILGSNLIKEDGTRDLEEYVIKEFDGLKIGIFGLATPESKYKSNPKNTEGVDFKDPVEVAEEMVKKLQAENVDMIIALVHLGIDEESEIKSTDIAKVEGIDLIVDGHSHTKLDEGQLEENALLVQTGNYLNNIGLVNIKFVDGKISEKTAKLIEFEEAKELIEDEDIKNAIEELDVENEKITSVVVGKTKTKLEGTREIVRGGESNLGNLATDAMLDTTGADVALTNGGGIRASIEPGEITMGDVLEVFPFGNYIVVKEVKGSDIKQALEHGAKSYPEPAGGFPHVAGMTYDIDTSKEEGNRIIDIMINGEPIDLEKTYSLATNDFMAVGGDGYEMLADGELVGEFEGLDEALVNYIKELGEVDYKVEGRIPAAQLPEPEPTPEQSTPEEQPAPELKPAPDATAASYTVKAGDFLWKIAAKFNTTWEKLAEHNKLKNPHLIFPGQKILIPAN